MHRAVIADIGLKPRVVSHGDHLPRGTFAVHSRFAHCVNFTAPHGVVSLVDPLVGPGPFNVVLSRRPPEDVEVLRIGDEVVFVGDDCMALDPADRYTSDPLLVKPDRVRQGLPLLVRHVAEHGAPGSLAFLVAEAPRAELTSAFERALVARLEQARDRILEGRLAEGAALAKGAGVGLTPSGDDFLYGIIVASHLAESALPADLSVARERVYRAALGDNKLSNTFLYAARSAWLTEPVKHVVEALWQGGRGLVPATDRLLAHGSTSGADVAVGLIVGTKYWLGI